MSAKEYCLKCNRHKKTNGGLRSGGRKRGRPSKHRSRVGCKTGGRAVARYYNKDAANMLYNKEGRLYKGGFGPFAAALIPMLAPAIIGMAGKLFGKLFGKGRKSIPPEFGGRSGTSGEYRDIHKAYRGRVKPASLGSSMKRGGILTGGWLEGGYAMPKGGYAMPTGGVLIGGKRRKGSGSKRGASNNPWIVHVKRYASKHGISYGQAISEARSSYKKM